MTRIMTRLSIPIRLRFMRIPATWEIRTLAGRTGREPVQFAFSKIQEGGEMLDHWSKAVIDHYKDGHPVPIDIRGLWKFRERLKNALVDTKAFKATYAPLLSRPETGVQLAQESGSEFPLRLEITDVASGVVTL